MLAYISASVPKTDERNHDANGIGSAEDPKASATRGNPKTHLTTAASMTVVAITAITAVAGSRITSTPQSHVAGSSTPRDVSFARPLPRSQEEPNETEPILCACGCAFCRDRRQYYDR